jgi:CRP-like cAMP-binding protein
MVGLDALEKVEILGGLEDRWLSAVSGCCSESQFQRGDKIFGSGEEARYLYAVMDGKVELRADPQSPLQENILQENRVFGWPSLTFPSVYRFSAYSASRNAKVIQFDAGCLKRLFEKEPELGYTIMSRLLEVIGHRFHLLQEEVVKRRGQDAMNRW